MPGVPSRIPNSAEFILHIGGPKTGSSAAQRACCLKADELRIQGIHYPPHRLDQNGVSGGHGDIFALLTLGRVEQARDALREQLAEARRANCRLLMSAEVAFTMAEKIMPVLPTPAFHIVSFVRHPMDALASHYNQGIKRGASRATLQQIANVVLSKPSAPPSLTGAALFDWLRLCGHERMTVLPYVEDGRAVNTPARLAAALGVTVVDDAARPVNASYTPAAVRFKLLVNHLPPPLLSTVDADLDVAVQAYSDLPRRRSWSLTHGITPETYANLENRFRADVERLQTEFGADVVAREAIVPVPPSAIAEDSVDSVEAVWSHVRESIALASRLQEAVAQALASEPTQPALVELAGIIGREPVLVETLANGS
jgi:hypothetical protein